MDGIDLATPVAEPDHRLGSVVEDDALVARVDLDAYADALLVLAEREIPALAALGDDVRARHVRAALRMLGALSVQALGERDADAAPEAAFVAAIDDIMVAWGLSVGDLAVVLSLSGSVLADQLLRGLSDAQALAVAERAGRSPGILGLHGRVISSVEAVRGAGDAVGERPAREPLGAPRHEPVEGSPIAGGRRCFVARITDAPPRAHAALTQALRDRGVDAETRSDHVRGVLPADAPVPSVDGAVVVAETRARDADAETRHRWLVEVADAATRIGVQGAFSDRDLIPHRLLIAAPRRWAALAARLGRVRDGGPAVLEATEAFARGGSVPSAASALGAHRETVRSRVKRAEKLAALDLTTTEGRSILALALVGSSLGEAPSGPLPVALREGSSSAGSGVGPAFARIDVGALTSRAVAILTCRALAAGADGDVDEIDPTRVRDGLLEAMRVLRMASPRPWFELTAASKRRLGQLTLGVPLGDAHGAFAEVLSALWRALGDVASRDERVALSRDIDRQWALATVIHQVVELRRHALGSRTDALGELLDALAAGSAPRHALAARAHLAGLDIDTRYRALVVVAKRETAAAAFAMTLRTAGWAAVARGREIQALVTADVTDAALRTLLIDACVACGSDVAALGDLGDTIPPLRRLVADADARGRRGLLDPEDEVVALLLLQRPDLATLLRHRVIGALASHNPARGVDLVATLTVYMDAGLRRGPTADALHVHPNSVDHRLRTIEELTGLSLANADDRLVLSLAVTAQRLATSLRSPCLPHVPEHSSGRTNP
ncbi:MAG: helix-turn-helix domain-containing protein [Solirubrobacteraceae bacterium]